MNHDRITEFTPGGQQIGLNPQVLFFTLLISLLTGIVFGLVPVRITTQRER